ncbi:hypothetical protein HDU98_000869 [Podochytrium sp. JEL0797]|nr:hypothetical protein HDU98_000869 [Podochytrium sp. JEL0797]
MNRSGIVRLLSLLALAFLLRVAAESPSSPRFQVRRQLDNSSFQPTIATDPTITSLPITSTNSSDPFMNVETHTPNQLVQLTAYSGTCAIFLISTGLVLVFFGHKLYKPLPFLAGFYFFGILAFFILHAIEAMQNGPAGGANRDLVYFLVCGITGIVGGCITLCIWKLALFAIGAALGYAVSLLLLMSYSWVLTDAASRYVVIGVVVVVFGVLAFWDETHVVVGATAVGGSYAAFVGLDVFLGTGFVSIADGIVTGKGGAGDELGNGGWVGMMVGCLFVAGVGVWVQLMGFGNGGKVHAMRSRERKGNDEESLGIVDGL